MGAVDVVVVQAVRRARDAVAAPPAAPRPALGPRRPSSALCRAPRRRGAARDAAAAARARRPHVLLDPDLAARPAAAKARMPPACRP